MINKVLYDAHERPPEHIKNFYKQCQKTCSTDSIIDFTNTEHIISNLKLTGTVERASIIRACEALAAASPDFSVESEFVQDSAIYEVNACPGLQVIPNIVPLNVQALLLSKLLHRDLNNIHHSTNVHFHHQLPYSNTGASFFSLPIDDSCEPINSSTHKPISIRSMLQKKLRWITLGGQYDWTEKSYVSGASPEFPKDISQFLQELIPNTIPQAAIVNIYSPGDTLSMHRDVAETTCKPLVSMSIGCDAIFVVDSLAMNIRSGDVIIMSGESRFAWHGVPKILANTCPTSLENWPGDSTTDEYDQWKGWMKKKRINLNVRQVSD